MKQGFFITGTDTGVGKTLIATALVHGFAQSGKRVIGMKPVAAGAALQDGQLLNDDVVQLIAASNVEAPLSLINPYVFEPPVAPHIAAAEAGISMSISKLKSDFESLNDAADIVVVEGAGGFLVPLNSSEDMADLAIALDLPVVLVVGMRLGCLNHALLTVAAIEARGLRLAGWIANRIDPEMTNFSENLESLKQRITAPCLGVVSYSNSMDFRQVSAYLELPTS
jgi:dethiobiotin synthetase